jgi:hypothetical protein
MDRVAGGSAAPGRHGGGLYYSVSYEDLQEGFECKLAGCGKRADVRLEELRMLSA